VGISSLCLCLRLLPAEDTARDFAVAGDGEKIKKGGEKCLTDMVEDLEGGDGDLASEEALPPGLLLAWEEEDCRDVAIS